MPETRSDVFGAAEGRTEAPSFGEARSDSYQPASSGVSIFGTPQFATRATVGADVSVTVASIPAGAIVVAFVHRYNAGSGAGLTSPNLTFTQRAACEDSGGLFIFTAVAASTLTNEAITYNSGTISPYYRPTLGVIVTQGGNSAALSNVFQTYAASSTTVAVPLTPTKVGSLIFGAAAYGDVISSATPNGSSTTLQLNLDDGDGNFQWFFRLTGQTTSTAQVSIGGTISTARVQERVAIEIAPP